MHQFFSGFSRYAALAVILFGSAVGCNLSAPTGGSPTGGSAGGSTGGAGPGGSPGGSSQSNGGTPDTGGSTVGPGGSVTDTGGINIVGGNGGTTFVVGGGGAAGGNGGTIVVGGNGGTIVVGGNGGTIVVGGSSDVGGSKSSGGTIVVGGSGVVGGSKCSGGTIVVGGSSAVGGSKSSGGTTSAGGSAGSSSSGGSTVVKIACTAPPAADLKLMPGYPDHAKYFSPANSMAANLTPAEKAQQMRGTDAGPATSRNWSDIFRQTDNSTRSIKGFTFRDGPRGVNLDAPIQATSTVHGKSTVFPVAMARGAAWDVNLEYQIGQTIGNEMAAAGQTMLLAPTVNLLRHPLWGRAQETYGEDPYQLGRLGTSLVAGVQTYVGACAKHYAANNIENGRSSLNSQMDEQTLHEIYTRHFEMIVKDGGVSCIMAAYNSVNGTKSTQSPELLTTILRTGTGGFGFNGFVMSDWWAMPGGSGGTPNSTYAATAIAAGLDMELPWSFHFSTIESSAGSSIPQAQITTGATRVLEQKCRFGLMTSAGCGLANKPAVTATFSGGSITNPNTTLAQTAAQESMVLLKNDNNTLPIKSTFTKIAVVGVSASYCATLDSSGNPTSPGITNCADDVNKGTVNFATGVRVGDVGSSRVNFDSGQAVAPLAGIQSAAGSGVTVTSGSTASSAAGADLVVVVAGLTPYDEGEEYNGSGDRTTLALDGKMNSGTQNKLITEVVALGKPVVVVLEGGSAIDMPWLSSVQAVVMAWYPGMKGGTALGQLLFGKANFSGKLPISWPKQLSDLPTFNAGTTTTMDYYVGYRYYDNSGKTPLFAFGKGLSYTQFTYSNLVVPCSTSTQSAVVNVSVDVTNSGTVAGDEVVFLFTSYPGATGKRPTKELKGFARVTLAAGAKQTVTIPLRVSDIKFWDGNGPWSYPSTVKVMVGPSSDSLPLSDTFTVTSTP